VADEHHREVAEDIVNGLLFRVKTFWSEERPKIMHCRMEKRKDQKTPHLLSRHEEKEDGDPVHVEKSKIVGRQKEERNEGQRKDGVIPEGSGVHHLSDCFHYFLL